MKAAVKIIVTECFGWNWGMGIPLGCPYNSGSRCRNPEVRGQPSTLTIPIDENERADGEPPDWCPLKEKA